MNELDRYAICYWPADFDSNGFKKCEASRETYEGRSAWMDSIVYLSERARPKNELKYSKGLSKACWDHVLDIGTKGNFGHDGSDGSTPDMRAGWYIVSGTSNVENLAFIDERNGLSTDAENIIASLIINDGELDRDSWNNLLSQDSTHVGIACGCHKTIGEVCCFAYGKDIDDGAQTAPNPLYDVSRQECTEASSSGIWV